MNFVVLTAALSSCNSGINSTGRMLRGLALQDEAPPRPWGTKASGNCRCPH
ncbi:hypothetical protein [Streptomyces sp. NPDC058086]|uniref:hypothetical protein n=1 Tax=Streptomyces sp. NPDC058086 TaxID=3346334 RepID=UPI0036DFB609